jgi:cell division protein ZapE
MDRAEGHSAADLSATLAAVAREHGFVLDPAQQRALHSLQRLYDDLARTGSGWLRIFTRPRPIRGIYLWGPVGRGKSFLMDEFYRLAPVARKQRVHFHRFMQSIHHALRELQGQEDPVNIIAARIARDVRLLCLDEFHITDIGDAMLMRRLLEGLLSGGIALITTSNQHPDALYEHGLQRAQFVPAIDLLKTHLELVELNGDADYRLRALTLAGVYHYPLGETAERAQEAGFVALAGSLGEADQMLEIEGREVHARRVAPGVAWFDFADLCDGPRGTADYIELARRYHTVLVSGVPRFGPALRDSLRRFTWLVDEFYDRHVNLMLSAEAPVDQLCKDVPTTPDIERTASRLIEMQSAEYLSLPHLA